MARSASNSRGAATQGGLGSHQTAQGAPFHGGGLGGHQTAQPAASQNIDWQALARLIAAQGGGSQNAGSQDSGSQGQAAPTPALTPAEQAAFANLTARYQDARASDLATLKNAPTDELSAEAKANYTAAVNAANSNAMMAARGMMGSGISASSLADINTTLSTNLLTLRTNLGTLTATTNAHIASLDAQYNTDTAAYNGTAAGNALGSDNTTGGTSSTGGSNAASAPTAPSPQTAPTPTSITAQPQSSSTGPAPQSFRSVTAPAQPAIQAPKITTPKVSAPANVRGAKSQMSGGPAYGRSFAGLGAAPRGW